ncbi:MAG: DNA-directed RNA polymerase subunit H [Candidatus Aenigmatarchaeota archaeon]|nr:MAG: DNA-directed RNA polymerase subunit H [Candidatus Aenigmarchaeota archaeon]
MAAKTKVKETADEDKEIRVSEHSMVPKHEIMGKEEKADLLKKFNVSEQQLPKISANDPAAKEIGAKAGDVVRIMRKSQTAGKTVYYRYVVGVSHGE